ncbi:uncharacterized protein LOC123227797 [Mangifera indica]|uniref:uncharacterized protein LOC123227797 n=1 Tax=Mangifera indica TaxID=29780 RepID=UPI001CFBBC25|nr:uncharacterized protein LOC123227797 [Mangifera indica]
MSTPPLLDQQPPPMVVTQQEYTTHSGHGSFGPVIAVLAVITILGVIAGMIGRLCSGRRVMGRREYDFESWVERKCSSCLDGNIDPHPTRPEIPVAEPVAQEAPPQEIKEEEEEEEQKSHGAQPK